jgi:hypothetical protein
VPAGTSRLRLALMASHTKSELREAASVLAACVPASAREAGLRVAEQATQSERGRVFDGLRDAA